MSVIIIVNIIAISIFWVSIIISIIVGIIFSIIFNIIASIIAPRPSGRIPFLVTLAKWD